MNCSLSGLTPRRVCVDEASNSRSRRVGREEIDHSCVDFYNCVRGLVIVVVRTGECVGRYKDPLVIANVMTHDLFVDLVDAGEGLVRRSWLVVEPACGLSSQPSARVSDPGQRGV